MDPDIKQFLQGISPEQKLKLAKLLKELDSPASKKGKSKTPARPERLEMLRQSIFDAPKQLASVGCTDFAQVAGPIKLLAPPVKDPRTGGWIGHVEEPLGSYLRRVDVVGNFSQRPPFDHVTDPIYRRLIRDFINGAVMPESKVAVLGTGTDPVVTSLEDPNTKQSMIDGLQRLYCSWIAVLLVFRGAELVKDGVIPPAAWAYFEDAVNGLYAAAKPNGSGNAAHLTVASFLQRQMRYEVFWGIDLEGLLHYMITFNTGQRRMSLQVQLEIMRQPLVAALEQMGVPIWHEMESLPGLRQPKELFSATALVLSARAFITANPHVTANEEAERVLNENEAYLDNIGGFEDVAAAFKRIANELHPLIMKVYADDPTKKFILSAGETFFLSLAAACGYIRSHGNMKMLEGALDKLVAQAHKPAIDPLNLDEYAEALTKITSSRGKTIRRLVYDTFLRFFHGVTSELAWADTANQITGVGAAA